MSSLKDQFLLQPDVIFLNHGSFGACPKPVFAEYQRWQLRLEQQPVKFLGREYHDLLLTARQALAAFLGASADDLVFVPNATHGVNIIAQSLGFSAGDEILTSNHEYGACDNAWAYHCQKTGAIYKQQALPLPLTSREALVDAFWQGVSPRTKLIYLSHITSPTALLLPVAEIIQRARQAGIMTFIDGAHAPGQLPLTLTQLDADFYTGNCHKWLLSPKGAGFLHVKPAHQHLIQPLVVSWGYQPNPSTPNASRFIDYLQWTGTHDPSAALAVPAAIQFMQENNWGAVQRTCHQMLKETLNQINALTGLPPVYPANDDFYNQMAIARLHDGWDVEKAKHHLYSHYRIEVPIIAWNQNNFVRISVQGYNQISDCEALIDAIREMMEDDSWM